MKHVVLVISCLALLVTAIGCQAPIGAREAPPRLVFQQRSGNALSAGQTSFSTGAILHRFDQGEQFSKSPDATLRLLHEKAIETGELDLLYALSELNYIEAERLRHSVRPWEPRDARDYYLASAVYAWFFIFGQQTNNAAAVPYDSRFRAACDFYDYGLGWALTGRRATNAIAVMQGGTRHLPVGAIDVQLDASRFPMSLTNLDRFVLANHLLVRGLSVRNGEPGLGTPLVAVAKTTEKLKLARCTPATAVLRIEGGLAELARSQCRASLELYSPLTTNTIQVGSQTVPLESDTTAAVAYPMNQSFVWSLGKAQFLSAKEQIPSDVYLTRPYQPGLMPVVFVHGTFSSPVWWAEMMNTLFADPELGKHCQFWYFIYNSGNPIALSANRLRELLTAKVKELDPEGRDPALQQMVVIGHSQGGLLTKLTATDTGDRLWRVVNTNRFEDVKLTEAERDLLRKCLFYTPLPFVKGVVFISTPHRGSYLAGNFARNMARKLVTLPHHVMEQGKQFIGLEQKFGLLKTLKQMPTSLDSMSPESPFLLALADIPTAPGVKAHSIISVQGTGDYHQGKDGLVKYSSAHVDYAESEFIVRSFHSCQDKPATIEEVRRILREHIASLPGGVLSPAAPAGAASPR